LSYSLEINLGVLLEPKERNFSAIEDNRNWIVQRIKPEKMKKRGRRFSKASYH